MSPTILPVLVLSILLVPLPTAEAGEITDLFALIRGTLKYWHRTYKMYEEEVTLGYCWADYFLHLQEATKNAPMSPPVSMDPLNFVPVDIHGFGGRTKRDRFSGVILVDGGGGFAHRNFTEKSVLKKGDEWKESVERTVNSGVYSRSDKEIKLNTDDGSVKDNLVDRLSWMYSDREYNRAKRSYVLANFTGAEGILGLLKSTVGERNRWKEPVKKCVNSEATEEIKLYKNKGSKRDKVDRFVWVDDNREHERSGYSYEVSNSTKREIFKNLEELAGITASNSKISKPGRESPSTSKCFLAKCKDQSHVSPIPVSKLYSETAKAKLPSKKRRIRVRRNSRSVDTLCRIYSRFSIANNIRESFPIAQQQTDYKNHVQIGKNHAKHEGNLVGSDLDIDTRKKVFYPQMNRVTSGTSARLKPSGRQTTRLSSYRKIASFDSRLKDIEPTGRLEDNREPDDFPHRRGIASSNLKFQRAEQRSFRQNYRRNLRRKRDANDRIRSLSIRPPSRSRRVSSYNPTTLDEIPRFSSRYRAPGNYISTSRTVPRSIDPRNDESFTKSKLPMYYLKRYRSDAPVNYSEGTMSSVALEESKNNTSNLIDVSREIFRASSKYQRLRNLSGGERGKRKNNRIEDSDPKQLSTGNDNRHPRLEHNFLVRVTVAGQMGKKQAIPYPMGQASLPPVSYLRFMGDYDNSTSVTARNSRASRSSMAKNQGRRSSTTKVEARGLERSSATLFHVRQVFTGFLRTLGFVVNVGRQFMDYVDSNSALACTKDYLVGKAIHWIDS